MELLLVKQFDNSFKVAYESDYEKLKKIKAGKTVKCKITMPRNVMFHRKFFALINMVYQNQERYNNIDDLREQLTIEAGYYKTVNNMQGEPQRKALSISFASMDEAQFTDYYSKVLDCIVLYFHFDKQLIIDNVEQHF
jgi:hypothetical protein